MDLQSRAFDEHARPGSRCGGGSRRGTDQGARATPRPARRVRSAATKSWILRTVGACFTAACVAIGPITAAAPQTPQPESPQPQSPDAGTMPDGQPGSGDSTRQPVAPVLSKPSGLRELARIARDRANRQRPAQVAALQPFESDLARAYSGDNVGYLDARFEQLAKLGDLIAPLLLELLAPADNKPETVNRAENVARVLLLIGPQNYTDALIELLDSSNETARRNAIRLLGASGEARAADALGRRLTKWTEPDQLEGLRSLAALGLKATGGEAAGGDSVARFLLSESRAIRRAAIDYLTAVDGAGAAIPAVADAFHRETADDLLLQYVEYFDAHAPGNAAIADRLLPLIGGARLDIDAQLAIVEALATISPAQHRPVVEALEKLVEAGGTGLLETAAALTLDKLGEKSGVRTINRRHDAAVRDARQESEVYASRGDWNLATGRHREAIRDYQFAIEYARSTLRRQVLYMRIARCEAHRGKPAGLRSALKDSGWNRRAIEAEAQADPVFAEALRHDSVQKFLESLDS